MIGVGERKRAIIARVPPFQCKDCKIQGVLDPKVRAGKNCTLALYQPDKWRGYYLETVHLGMEGDTDCPEPPEPLQDTGCPAGYHTCGFVRSLAPYRPQRYGSHIMAGRPSEDPLVEEALRILSFYLSESHDRYQEAIVHG